MGFPSDEGLADLIQGTGGVTVTVGSVTSYGHRETVDEIVAEGGTHGVIVDVPSVVVPTSVFASEILEVGEPIFVAGDPYTIRDHRRLEDGALTQIFLAE